MNQRLTAAHLHNMYDADLPQLFYEKHRTTTSKVYDSSKIGRVDIVRWQSFERECEMFRQHVYDRASTEELGTDPCVFDHGLFREVDTVLCGNEHYVLGRIVALVTNSVDYCNRAFGKPTIAAASETLARDARNLWKQMPVAKEWRSKQEIFKNDGLLLSPDTRTDRRAKMVAQEAEPSGIGATDPTVERKVPKKRSGRYGEVIPDLVVSKHDGRVVIVVVEVKVPWCHDLEDLAELWAVDEDSSDRNLMLQRNARELLGKSSILIEFRGANSHTGQIIDYMQKFGVRYGYMTTYDASVFLEFQEAVDGWVIACSPVVKWNNAQLTKSGSCPTGYSRYSPRLALAMVCDHMYDEDHRHMEALRLATLVSRIVPPKREATSNHKSNARIPEQVEHASCADQEDLVNRIAGLGMNDESKS